MIHSLELQTSHYVNCISDFVCKNNLYKVYIFWKVFLWVIFCHHESTLTSMYLWYPPFRVLETKNLKSWILNGACGYKNSSTVLIFCWNKLKTHAEGSVSQIFNFCLHCWVMLLKNSENSFFQLFAKQFQTNAHNII